MTDRKYIEELTVEELTQVFNNNEKLQNQVLEDMIESEMHWISEKMDYIRKSLSDWSIGTGQRNYIIVKTRSMNEFLEGLKQMGREVPAFSDTKAAEIIGKLEKAAEAYYNADIDIDEDEYDLLEEGAEDALKEAADELADQFTRDLNGLYDHDTQLDYFLDFYSNARMEEEETYYIHSDSETYKLYQDVSYTKSY